MPQPPLLRCPRASSADPVKFVIGLCSSAVGRRSSTRHCHAPLCFRIHYLPPAYLHRSARSAALTPSHPLVSYLLRPAQPRSEPASQPGPLKLHRSRRPRRSSELNYIGLGQRMPSFEQSIVCRRSCSSLTRFHPASVATYSRYMIILMDSWSILPKQRGCFYFNRF